MNWKFLNRPKVLPQSQLRFPPQRISFQHFSRFRHIFVPSAPLFSKSHLGQKSKYLRAIWPTLWALRLWLLFLLFQQLQQLNASTQRWPGVARHVWDPGTNLSKHFATEDADMLDNVVYPDLLDNWTGRCHRLLASLELLLDKARTHRQNLTAIAKH